MSTLKQIVVLSIPIFFCTFCTGQKYAGKSDNLKQKLTLAKDDSIRFARLNESFYHYLWRYPDSSLTYVQQEILLAKQTKSAFGLSQAYLHYGWFYITIGDYPQALHSLQESLKFAEQSESSLAIAKAYDILAQVHMDEGDYEHAISYETMAKSLLESHWRFAGKIKVNDTLLTEAGIILGIISIYEELNHLDSAFKYNQILSEIVIKATGKLEWAPVFYEFGNIYSKKGDNATAIQNYRSGITFSMAVNDNKDLIDNYNGIANTFKKMGELDSGIFYANKVLEVDKFAHYSLAQSQALNLLADIYKTKNNIDSVSKYFQLAIIVKDSLFSQQKVLQLQSMTFNEQLRQQELVNEKKELLYKQQLEKEALTKKILIASVLVLLVLAFISIRNIALKRRNEAHRRELLENKLRIHQLENKKKLAELEMHALRAQMNPHFIFNCMNSIKSLIQKDENEKAATYLITFSKLIRTIFQNSDKREITLFDEIETCRLYTQLESLRFGNKFSYEFDIDEMLDLKSVMVPALIVQPFIENAIWHGIMPKEDGGRLIVKVGKTDHTIICIIDDDGIGINTSKQNKFKGLPSMHESKGVHLTQARLDLDNLLNERNMTIKMIDKKDGSEKPAGTTIILTFKEGQ